VSTPSRSSAPAHGGLQVGPLARTPSAPSHALGGWAARIGVSRWSSYGWAAIGVTTAFVAITCWWVTQDASIPIYDVGDHLAVAFIFHDMIRAGNLLGPFNYESPYPPLGAFIGALATFVGGVNIAPPVIGENLVFVPLLAFGCYRTGRLLFGARAGLLAVVFVFGSPLLIAQFHVFMLDAPETAVVAVSIWLLLMCKDFSDVRFAALAGLVVGLGLLTKVQFPAFVAGIVLMILLRGGWRNRRGLIVFALVAFVVAAPWYLDHLEQFATFATDAGPHQGVPVGDTPATWTLTNFTWYFWNIMNSQFLAPLFTLIVGGTLWTVMTLFRHRSDAFSAELPAVKGLTARDARTTRGPGGDTLDADTDRGPFGARLEFFAGVAIAWLLITLTPSHDIRYGMPLMPYLAVIATGWIVYLPRTARLLAIALVVLGVSANTLSTTFGVGRVVHIALKRPRPHGEEDTDDIRLYTNVGFLVAGPRRDGDVPGLLEALHREGVKQITWGLGQSRYSDFSTEGIVALARIANLSVALAGTPEFYNSTQVATLIHEPITAQAPPPCTRVSNDAGASGVWVARYDPTARKLALYCPTRRPQYYDIGGV
jgi:4-amino-4-deoxy-L-arabinose transferase-like glycosyltransferase